MKNVEVFEVCTEAKIWASLERSSSVSCKLLRSTAANVTVTSTCGRFSIGLQLLCPRDFTLEMMDSFRSLNQKKDFFFIWNCENNTQIWLKLNWNELVWQLVSSIKSNEIHRTASLKLTNSQNIYRCLICASSLFPTVYSLYAKLRSAYELLHILQKKRVVSILSYSPECQPCCSANADVCKDLQDRISLFNAALIRLLTCHLWSWNQIGDNGYIL